MGFLNAAKTRKLDKWDQRYIDLARYVASWSKDSTRVGAVIVGPNKERVIALGFNGFPVRVEDRAEHLSDDKMKNDMVIHAEQNALLFAGQMASRCYNLRCGEICVLPLRRPNYTSRGEESYRARS